MAGIISAPLMTAYVSSKWSLEAFSDALRVESLIHNVSVSVIEPAYVQSDIFDKQRNLQVEKAVEKAKDLYGHLFTRPAYQKRCEEKASPPTVTSEAIWDAFSNKYPRTRYVVANVDGRSARILRWITWILPDRAKDMLVMRLLLKEV